MQPTRTSHPARTGGTRAPTRSLAVAALFSAAALMNAAMATTGAVSTIVAGDRLGAGWGGLPNTAAIAGTGLGALALTGLMNRRGRRAGLALGYVAALCGGAIAVAAVAADDVSGLIVGMVLLGLGNAGAQLSRYAAADLYPPDRRGLAIGIVVWAGTIGAVGGPLLLDPSADVATALGHPAVTGPFLLAALAAAGAVVVTRGVPGRTERAVPSRMPLRELARTPAARSALAVMVTAQVVMVAVMTAAPLDMHMHGAGLGVVGMTLSAHTLGMFALSPLTGRLLDHIGARAVMLAGLVTLMVASGLAALSADQHAGVRTVALFLLGYGWNLCFVGGSGRLSRDLPASERASVEGAVDAAVWGVAAGASLAATAIMSAGGYAALAGLAAVLAVLPVVFLRRDDRARTTA